MLCEEVSPSLSALIPSLYLHIDPSILLIVLEIPRRCTIPAPNPGHRVAVLLRPIPFLSPRPFRNPLTLESLRLSRINLGNFHRRIVARFCGKTGATTCLEFYFELFKKKKKNRKKEKRKKRRQQRKKESRQREVGKVLFRSLVGLVAASIRDARCQAN